MSQILKAIVIILSVLKNVPNAIGVKIKVSTPEAKILAPINLSPGNCPLNFIFNLATIFVFKGSDTR